MADTTAAKRYAKSFLIVSSVKGIVEEVEEQLLAIKKAYLTDDKLRQFMTNPRIPQKAKMGLVRKMLQGKANPYVGYFMELLVRRHRFALVPEIADWFDTLADAFRGVIRVQVKSYGPLTEAHKKQLELQISRIVKGQKIDMLVEQDPSLMGGLWVRIGDTLIDGTVATKLKTLREKLFELTLA
jgi:F-type H+-transporting ATPase subunit delta